MDAGIREFLDLMKEHETNRVGQAFTPEVDIAKAGSPVVRMSCHSICDLSVLAPATVTAILDTIDDSLAGNVP